MPTLTGTTGPDELIGSDGDDVIDGRGGADRIYGRGGADRITGVMGAVEVYGGSGDDTVTVGFIDGARPPVGTTFSIGTIDGGDGYDTLIFDSTGVDPGHYMTITAAQGAPGSLRASLSETRVSGFFYSVARIDGFERIIGANVTTEWSLGGTAQSWNIVGGSGNDSFSLGANTAVIRAGGGNDIFGVTSGSELYGEDGDDVFSISWGLTAVQPTVLDGGDGNDTIRLYAQNLPETTINFTLGDGVFGGVTYRSIENLILDVHLSQGRATLNIRGSAADNFIDLTPTTGVGFLLGGVEGGDGDDVIIGARQVTIYGGAGDDTLSTTGDGYLYGNEGNDILTGNRSMFGGTGDDTLNVSAFAASAWIEGGDGIDTLVLDSTGLTGGFQVNLLGSTLSRQVDGLPRGAVVVGIERVIGSAADDTIVLANIANGYARGGLGADRITGGSGRDILYGDGLTETSSDGADILSGEGGDDLIFGGGGNDQLSGGAGDDVLIGGSGSNLLDGGDGKDLAVFSFARSSATITYVNGDIRIEGLTGSVDTVRGVESLRFTDGVYDVVNGQVAAQGRIINGTTGNDRLTGTTAADILNGGAGADILRGGAGSDFIDGGAGIDTARYGGTIRSYATVSTSVVMGGEEGGTDLLSGIEVLQFLDGRLSFDTSAATTVVYRLYDAAFDRAPDVFGLADYGRAISEGRQTVQQILDIFAGSAEFQARYGALNNDQFVREMYRFSLNREGDAAGVATYVAALNAGTVTRSQLLGIFSESQEHQAQINAVITAKGLFVQDEQTASVARLYDSVFNRLPDLGGLKGYRDALDNGYTLRDITSAMVGSPEFQTRFGSLTNQQFVEQLYRFVLDREGDAAGVQTYVAALNNGTTNRTDLVLIFSDSLEHRVSYQATYDSQIRRLGVDGYDPGGTGAGQAAEADPGKHADAFVLPAEPAFEVAPHDDAVAVLETAANDHVLIDHALFPSSMPLDPVIAIDDLTVGRHRSDWM